MRSPIRGLVWAILVASLLWVGVRPLSRHFLFPAPRGVLPSVPADVVRWTLRARDGVEVQAIEIPGPPSGKVFVAFHNNRQSMQDGLSLGRALAARGFGVVLPEYRGYGSSAGEPSEEGLYCDAEAVLDALAQRGVGADRVVLFGASLGTGVAAEMARRGRGSALVLVSPYTSIPDVVTDAVPLVPTRWLLTDRFETLSKAAEIHVPTLIVHGDADEIVPFWMGQKLSRAIALARLLPVPGGHHGDLFARARPALVSAMAELGDPD